MDARPFSIGANASALSLSPSLFTLVSGTDASALVKSTSCGIGEAKRKKGEDASARAGEAAAAAAAAVKGRAASEAVARLDRRTARAAARAAARMWEDAISGCAEGSEAERVRARVRR